MHLHRPGKVVSHVYDSTLFDHLDSTWEFKPGPTPSSTWLYFSVDFAFKSPLYRHIASVFFDEVRMLVGSLIIASAVMTYLISKHKMELVLSKFICARDSAHEGC